ncbi:MAG TPA: helix-turn-helix transcriptional regulator [Iamia sp.]|nr:helix-turn-helix transcriptional regulator [Iamia sp.]
MSRAVAGWRPDQLRQIRLDRGLTQAQLGDRVGVSKTTVYLWERAGPEGRAPTAPHLHRLAEVLRLDDVAALLEPEAATTPEGLRHLTGRTQIGVAALLGVHHSTVGNFEKGDYWPAKRAEEWAAAYGVEVADLLWAWSVVRRV